MGALVGTSSAGRAPAPGRPGLRRLRRRLRGYARARRAGECARIRAAHRTPPRRRGRRVAPQASAPRSPASPAAAPHARPLLHAVSNIIIIICLMSASLMRQAPLHIPTRTRHARIVAHSSHILYTDQWTVLLMTMFEQEIEPHWMAAARSAALQPPAHSPPPPRRLPGPDARAWPRLQPRQRLRAPRLVLPRAQPLSVCSATARSRLARAHDIIRCRILCCMPQLAIRALLLTAEQQIRSYRKKA